MDNIMYNCDNKDMYAPFLAIGMKPLIESYFYQEFNHFDGSFNLADLFGKYRLSDDFYSSPFYFQPL